VNLSHHCVFSTEQLNSSAPSCPECGNRPTQLDGFQSFAPELANTLSGFDPDGFKALAAIEDGHFWFRARNRVIATVFRNHFPLSGNFLEVGCGTGFVLSGLRKEFPGLRLFGSEVHTKGLVFARDRVPGAQFFQMDARRIPFEGSFDIIGAFDVIEHIDEDLLALRQFHRALRPGGGILLTVPQHMFLWSSADDIAYHKRRYSRAELVNKVREAGFTVRYVSSFITMLFPLMLLSRFINRRVSHETLKQREMASPGISTYLLEKICSIDLAAVRLGLSLPFGGSLILVATKDHA
jgi:SAM-dependent methyltransferase